LPIHWSRLLLLLRPLLLWHLLLQPLLYLLQDLI